MHLITYLVCYVFFHKLKHLDYALTLGHHYSEKLWAIIYGAFVFISLGFGMPGHAFLASFKRAGTTVPLIAENVVLTVGESLLVGLILGSLFFVTVRLGGHFIGGRYMLIMVVPGALINQVIAGLLIVHL